MVGRLQWKKNYRANKEVQEWATKSDEAFGLLLMDNYIETWAAEANRKVHGIVHQDSQEGLPKSKYTVVRAGGGQDNGWTNEGIRRYNELMVECAEDRRDTSTDFDITYMTYWKEEDNKKGRKRKRTADNAAGGERVLLVDDWD